MRNNEAIRTLKANYPDACFEQLREAVDVAINALTALPEKTQLSEEDATSDCISRKAAIDTVGNVDCSDGVGISAIACEVVEDIQRAIKDLPSAQPPVPELTCNGCRHVGTYDTDFPCSVCIRREKDYYESE